MGTTPGSSPPAAEETDGVPESQGQVAGVPYDLRRPTVARTAARWWNPSDPRMFTPKAFGAGWDLNLYWLVHPVSYARARRGVR